MTEPIVMTMNDDPIVLVAPICGCGQTKVPNFINVTSFDDARQRWVVAWHCISEGTHGHTDRIQG